VGREGREGWRGNTETGEQKRGGIGIWIKFSTQLIGNAYSKNYVR
jgi:hypothetical protein